MPEFDAMHHKPQAPRFYGGNRGNRGNQIEILSPINGLVVATLPPTSEGEVATVATKAAQGVATVATGEGRVATCSGNDFIEGWQQLSDLVATVATVATCPARVGARIVQMIPNRPRELPPEALMRDHVQRGLEIKAHVAEMVALQGWMAHEFGRVRGWRQSRSGFDVAVLASGKTSPGPRLGPLGMGHHGAAWLRKFTDHRYHYRWPDRRAAAVVGHPYDVTAETREDAERWAAANGLRVSFPTDFPSWWYPGRTTLVLFERATNVVQMSEWKGRSRKAHAHG